ncbi:MAG: S41 family peptidase [Bacteroidota bacterium]
MMKLLKFTLSFLAIAFSYVSLAQENPLWMRYPAISPNGEAIVFSYKGDLYKVSSGGGLAIPLTTHAAHDFMPVWSDDSKAIAFASDRYGNFDIYTMPADGGQATRLTFHSSNDFPSDFAPDGSHILFSSLRKDDATYAQYPYGRLPELYEIDVNGGRPKQVTSITAEEAKYNTDGSAIIYQDKKGYEDPWRKHHTSSVTRDIWMLEKANNKYTRLATYKGEDRSPVFSADGKHFYYLCEASGSFNVFKAAVEDPAQSEQLSDFEKHPVRFLSSSKDELLCFSFNGEVFTMKKGERPQKVNIIIKTDTNGNDYLTKSINKGATEIAVSPNGKEIAFVHRGEIYVAPVEGGDTKRVTNTPEQERSVSFSPDGKKLLYAGERNGSWNVYSSSIVRKEEPYFYAATLLKEETITETAAEEFQPSWSPDGREVAYLEERVVLKVVNIATKEKRTILSEEHNYSYADGDQHYAWSPDGKWFLVEYNQPNQWISEAGLVSAKGGEAIINLTKSGFSDVAPQWMMDGKMMLWFSDRDGMKNRGSWGSEDDVYATFFTQEAFDLFKLSKTDYELYKEKKEEEEKDEEKEDEKEDDEEKLPEVAIELDGLEDRKVRLTIHSSRLSDAVVSKDGEYLYYICRFEKGMDLWKTNLRTKETKILTKLGGSAGNLSLDKEGENAFLLSEGSIKKVDTKSGEVKTIGINGEMYLDKDKERAYVFEHAWRQVQKKFYVKDIHNVDWDFYKSEYGRFLPHINNNYDFAEMLSEMLGELNASHTGCRYRPDTKNADETASLGMFFDNNYTGAGLKIVEVIEKGPADKAESKISEGTILEKIDGESITANTNYYPFLNRKADKKVLLSLLNPATGNKWEEVIEPISFWEENDLLYHRWVENRREEVERLSDGKVGYVHVRGMNDASFRTTYEEVLGRNYDKEALIVDTRFNGGGWLHDDLATFLNGIKYIEMVPRGQKLGSEPQFKWTKESIVLMGEGNYSDAHMFPYAYKANNIGKLLGMPVPGTGTAVWWERQIDPTLVFGIPQVGMIDIEGNYLENNQLEPDVKVENQPSVLLAGKDEQIAKAIEVLLGEQTEMPEGQEIQLEKKSGNPEE